MQETGISKERVQELLEIWKTEGGPGTLYRLPYAEVLSIVRQTVMIPDLKEVTRYKKHGLARIHLNIYFNTVNDIIVDMASFRKPTSPVAGWISSLTRAGLDVVISDDRQSFRNSAIRFEQSRSLEALLVELSFNVSPKSEISYAAELVPLYHPITPTQPTL